MGKRTVRHDNLTTCGECGLKLRPCNWERHVRARHPNSDLLRQFESRRIADMLRAA